MLNVHFGDLRFRPRVCLLILAIAALWLALSGCKPKPETTRLMVWTYIQPETSAGQDAMHKEFERRHPGVKVVRLNMGAGQMNPQKLMTSIVGKVPPDVVNQDRFTIGDWASRDTFRPLNDLIERDKNDKYAVR